MLGQMVTLLVFRVKFWCIRATGLLFVAGTPVGRAGSTSLMKLHTVEG